MPVTRLHHARRDDTPAFEPNMFYTFANPSSFNKSISTGISTDGVVRLTDFGSASSENWQVFFQNGRYFIRNYDYGANMQLGLASDNKNTPKMYMRNGSLGQQWIISKVEGGWQLVNALAGSSRKLALPSGWGAPGMLSDDGATVWSITSNPSAAKSKPLSGDWTNSVNGFEIAPSTSSSSPSTTTSLILTNLPSTMPSGLTIDPRESPLAAPGNPPKTTPLTHSGPLPSSSSSPGDLAGGAVAGIVVGAVILSVSLIFALWFFCVKKKRQESAHGTPYEIEGTPHQTPKTIASSVNYSSRTPSIKYAYRAELATPPAELPSTEIGTIHNRAELDSGSVYIPSEKN